MADEDKKRFALPATGGIADASNPPLTAAEFKNFGTIPNKPDGVQTNKSTKYLYAVLGRAVLISRKPDGDDLTTDRSEIAGMRIAPPADKLPKGKTSFTIKTGGTKIEDIEPGSALMMLHLTPGKTVDIGQLKGARLVLPDGNDNEKPILTAEHEMDVLVIIPPKSHQMLSIKGPVPASDIQRINDQMAEFTKAAAEEKTQAPGREKIATLKEQQAKYEDIEKALEDLRIMAEKDKKAKPADKQFKPTELNTLLYTATAFKKLPNPMLRTVEAGVARIETLGKMAELTKGEQKEKEELGKFLDITIKKVEEEIAKDIDRDPKERRFTPMATKQFQDRIKKLDLLRKNAALPALETGTQLASAAMPDLSGVNLDWATQTPAPTVELPADLKGGMVKPDGGKGIA